VIADGTDLFTIGELARATGLTVRTIRYWSDEGALPPVARSQVGYRLYDAGSVARLELIRTLRDLGLGLEAVRGVLSGETTVAEVAAASGSGCGARPWTCRTTRRPSRSTRGSSVVRERLRAAANDRLARYRELLSRVHGRPLPAHREEFAWVVAARGAHGAS
jgi:DNA-binding transcriptional MerR regulator